MYTCTVGESRMNLPSAWDGSLSVAGEMIVQVDGHVALLQSGAYIKHQSSCVLSHFITEVIHHSPMT